MVGGHLPQPGGLRERDYHIYLNVTVEAADDKRNKHVVSATSQSVKIYPEQK